MAMLTFQYGKTPLHRAVEGNNRDVVELLLKSGADVNVTDKVNNIHRYAKTSTATEHDCS